MWLCTHHLLILICFQFNTLCSSAGSPHTAPCNPLKNRRKRISHLGLSLSYQVTRHCCYGRFRSPSILTPHCPSITRPPVREANLCDDMPSLKSNSQLRLSCWFHFFQLYFTWVNPNAQLFAQFWISCALCRCNGVWEIPRYGLDTQNPDNWSAIIK